MSADDRRRSFAAAPRKSPQRATTSSMRGSAADAPEKWTAVWSEIQWQDNADSTPEAERPTRIRLIDGSESDPSTQAPLQQFVTEKEGVIFTFTGLAGKPRSMSWTGRLPKSISTEKCRYALLTFRAEGIRRIYEPTPMVSLQGVNDQTAGNAITLLLVNMTPNDGRSHTLLTQLPEGFTLQQLKVSIFTEDDKPRFVLERLELLSEAPEVFGADIDAGASKPMTGFTPVDISGAMNGSIAAWHDQALTKHKTVFNGIRDLKAGTAAVSGIPFTIASDENNLAVMPESKPSDKRIEFLGHMVDERYLEPKSRHDMLSVDVPNGAVACEAFLLLALSAAPVQVLGGQPHVALHLDDIESLSIELTYDRGENETAFPYSLADKGCYIPSRQLGAYAVAVDPARKLKKITLHNRHYGPNFALAGVTLNTSDKPVVPELATVSAPEAVKLNPEPAAKPVAVVHQGKRLTISNRWYEYGFDLTDGFVIDRFVNRWNADAKVQVGSSSGLRLKLADAIYTGRCFKAEVVRTTKTMAEVKLTSTREAGSAAGLRYTPPGAGSGKRSERRKKPGSGDAGDAGSITPGSTT